MPAFDSYGVYYRKLWISEPEEKEVCATNGRAATSRDRRVVLPV